MNRIRIRAIAGMAASAVLACVFVAFLYWERTRGREWVGPGLALPLVPFLFFLTELLFGEPVANVARKWDDLAGWQRGLLGSLVVIASFGVLFVVMLFLAT